MQCESDEMAFFNVTDLDLQGPEDCEDEDGSFRYCTSFSLNM